MKFTYYPGCSLEGTAHSYDESARAVCQALDITLIELDGWVCCGSSSAHTLDEHLGSELPAHNLRLASATGLDMAVPCAMCYHRLRVAQMGHASSGGELMAVRHLLHILADEPMLTTIKNRVIHPLQGLKVACYYGCLLARPAKIADVDNPENPMRMDYLMEAIGATSLPWSGKVECCGASLSLPHPQVVEELVKRLLSMAEEASADLLVTACPMCQSNLETRRGKSGSQDRSPLLPSLFFTELVGLSLGLYGFANWMSYHLISPQKTLEARKLL